MKFSLRLKTHDSIMKLIIAVLVLVGILILSDIIIIMNMLEEKPLIKENKSIKKDDFITQAKLNASKNNIFILK